MAVVPPVEVAVRASVHMRRKRNDRDAAFRVPLLYAFRKAAEERDSQKRDDEVVGGEKVVSARGGARAHSLRERELKQDLQLDLESLISTVDLGSAMDLTGLPRVEKSVLNYGLYDIAHLTSEDLAVEDISTNLHAAILQHEPRLISETLSVRRAEGGDIAVGNSNGGFDVITQRVRIDISAEMMCTPLDVPVDFVAEIEVGSGKVQIGGRGRDGL